MSDTQGTMAHQSVLDYFKPDSRPSNEIAVVWRRGYRTLRWSYADLLRTAMQFALELEARGIAKGDRVFLWGENSGEWVAAFLGCLLRGAVAVPMDAIAGIDFAARVAAQADVRIAMVGRGLPSLGGESTALCLEDLQEIVRRRPAEGFSPAPAERGDLVEVVFTSGTTAEPR
ncbi:MAG: AMP-binding protein, partial [Deltaproteobacteria bacterium]